MVGRRQEVDKEGRMGRKSLNTRKISGWQWKHETGNKQKIEELKVT
jgi:hypothetical protein